MKLYYFDVPGRAQVTRIMLKSAGREFEDVRFTEEEWKNTYKKMSPTGQCPFLECDDGTLLAQTTAIEVYVSTMTGYQPKDDLAAANGWMLYECFRDMWKALEPSIAMKDMDERIQARKALLSEGGAAAHMLSVIDKTLAKRNTEFAVSDKPSLIDISLYHYLGFMESGKLDGVDKEMFTAYPKMLELREKVAAIPAIADVK